MPSYKIERWDSVVSDGNIYANPMLYFKPDSYFREYVKKNGYKVDINISSTGLYDKITTGIVDSSDLFPNNRPNFYNATGYWVITVMTEWLGYPLQLGSFSIGSANDKMIEPELRSLRDQIPKPITLDQQQALDNLWEYYSDSNDKKLSPKMLILVLSVIVLGMVIAVGVTMFKKPN